jgi:hypothetical protein
LWIECRPHLLQVIVEPSRENVTGVNLLENLLRDELRWPWVVRQILVVDGFDWCAAENAALHCSVHRSWLVTVQAARRVLHRGAEVLVEVGCRREYVSVVCKVGEVHAECCDYRDLGIRQPLPGFHRLHIRGHAGDRAFD